MATIERSPEPRRPWGVPATGTIVVAIAFAVTVLVLIGLVVGLNPGAWFRGLSLDFPYYVWRTNVVGSKGLDALAAADVPGLNLERPGLPVLAALLGSILRIDTVTMVHAIQVAGTVGVGLAAGAFALAVLDEERWSFFLYAVVTAAASEIAWTSLKSLDNLLVGAVGLAIAVAALRSAAGGRGRAAAIAGFAAIALIHWFFALLFLALLAGVTLVLLPWSVVMWRRGESPWRTPAARLALTVVGAGAAGAASLAFVAPGPPEKLPPRTGTNRGNLARLPSLQLWLRGPLALLGAIGLWFPADTRRRIGAIFLVAWGLSVPLAFVASEVLDQPLKVFRVAGFALGIPILCAAALAAAVRIGRREGPAGLAIAVAIVVAGVAFAVASGQDVYRMPDEDPSPGAQLDQVRAMSPYLETLPADTPLVFLVSRKNPFLVDRLVRAGLPAERALDARLFWGGIEDLNAEQPGAQLAGARAARVGRAWFHAWWRRGAEAFLGLDRAVLYASTLNTVLPPPAGARELAPGVLLVEGAAPPAALRQAPPPIGTTWPAIAGATIAVLALLALAGSGWTRWLLDVDGLALAGLAPVVGIASIALIGTILGRLGVALGGTSGALVLLGIAAVGWAPQLAGRLRRDADGGPAPDEGPA